MSSDSQRRAVTAALVVAVAAVYAPVLSHGFVEFDDPLYVGSVARAPGAGAGLLGWAFGNDEAYLFHPLTWLSYRLDLGLHGLSFPGGWLATNVALHAAGAALLFRALGAAGAALAPSAFVAGLFALHPVQVESVAWVSGRKEVLAGFFFAATLAAYAGWVRRGGAGRALAWNGLAGLGLLAKGTFAVVPGLLLLFDHWPLARFGEGPLAGGPAARRAVARALVEKLPLAAAAAAAVAVGLAYAAGLQNVWVEDPPLARRLAEAPSVLLGALGRLLWPVGLTLAYPSPRQMGMAPASAASLLAAAAVVVGLTGLALAAARRRPALAVGWLWFAGALVPALGILPVGIRTLHDRYLYVPMIGLAIVVAFAGAEAAARAGRRGRVVGLVAAGGVLLALSAASSRQVDVWRDSESLYTHALAVTPQSAVAHYGRGIALARAGDRARAIGHLRQALAIHPRHADAATALGWLLVESGRADEALAWLELAVSIRPDWALARTNLARGLEAVDRSGDALVELETAVRRAPDSADARYWLARARWRAGDRAAATAALHEALRLQPGHPWARRLSAEMGVGEGGAGAGGADPR